MRNNWLCYVRRTPNWSRSSKTSTRSNIKLQPSNPASQNSQKSSTTPSKIVTAVKRNTKLHKSSRAKPRKTCSRSSPTMRLINLPKTSSWRKRKSSSVPCRAN
uniref:(northern house mosquito) hypothetical protein n=1 Tax=Culex pipiens TaxID=7175 RepID=A0A8D8B352_CULPI